MKRVLVLLFLVPSIGLAQMDAQMDDGEIRYTWFGLGHATAELDAPGDDLDASGWNFNVAFTVRDHIHLFADYQSLELDDFEEVSAKQKTFGIGTHFDVADNVSLFGRVGFLDISGGDDTVTLEDDGLRAIAGARFMPWAGFEFRAGVDYVDLDFAGDDTGGFVGTDIWLTEVISLTGEYQVRDDGQQILIGGRLYFGE